MRVSRSISISITSISLIFIFLHGPVALGQDQPPEYLSTSLESPIVEKVILEGVKSFDYHDIKKYLYTKENHWYNFFKKRELSRSNVKYDNEIIMRYYKRRGFLFATAIDSIFVDNKNKATVVFKIEENSRTYLSGVGISGGLDTITRKFNKTISQFKVGEPVNESKVLAGRFTLRDIYNENGYPWAQVTSRYEFGDDSSLAFVQFEVAESLYTYNGQTRLTRQGYTHENVILRELVNKPGKPYSRKDMIESERRLLSTGLFKYLSLSNVDSTARIENDSSKVDFSLNYEERKLILTNVGTGVGQETDFGVVYRITGRWGIRNLAGTGRQLYIIPQGRWQVNGPHGTLKSLGWKDVGKPLWFRMIGSPIEIDYIEPWFLGRRMPLTLKAVWEPSTLNNTIPDFEYRYDRYAFESFLVNELDRFTTARLSVSTEYINIINVPPDQQEAFRAEGDNQIRRKISLYGERDTRDNFFVPQHGSYSFVGVDYIGKLLGGDFNYFKAQFSWSRYQILIGQNVLATRLWFGWLDDLGKNGRSSADDRFMLGGATTIRGYSENTLGPVFVAADNPGDKLGKPKGGRYMMLGNIEIRRSLFWRFGGTAFVDAGNTYSNFEDITPMSLAFSSGMGLQFFTPIGPIRLDYGVRLQKNLDLGAGKLHLSILYAF